MIAVREPVSACRDVEPVTLNLLCCMALPCKEVIVNGSPV